MTVVAMAQVLLLGRIESLFAGLAVALVLLNSIARLGFIPGLDFRNLDS